MHIVIEAKKILDGNFPEYVLLALGKHLNHLAEIVHLRK